MIGWKETSIIKERIILSKERKRMNFVQVSRELPRFNERVVVKDMNGFYFTAKLEADEDGDYWSYDLPPGIIANGEVSQEIISWAYPD